MLKIVLCDTIMHPTPILFEWMYGLKDLGYDVTYIPVPQESILKIIEPVDVIVYAGVNNNVLNDFIKIKNRFPKVKIIGASSEWNYDFVNFVGIIDFFIAAIDNHPSVKSVFNYHGYDWHNIALAANHKFFYKMENVNKIYDACFIGTLYHGYRGEDKFLYPILDNIKYKSFLGGMTYKNYNLGFIPYQNHNLIRNQTKINLNFHVPYQKPNSIEFPDRLDCNQSVFNIALAGAFQLCDHPLAEKYFEGNVIVANESNWLDAFEYYLNNEKEREEKAYNSMNIAKNKHTWLKRMEEFVNIINNYEK